MKAIDLAIFFHETYENLAPEFGYNTRQDTKVFDEKSKNGKLMVAVCERVISEFLCCNREEIFSVFKEWIEKKDEMGDSLKMAPDEYGKACADFFMEKIAEKASASN